MRTLSFLLAPLALVALVALVPGCSDPPPPSLSAVSIHNTSNDEATSITYVRDADGDVVGDASKGIAIGDGLSIMLTLGRTISDPPSKKADAEALTSKAFKLTVNGDVFTATPVTNVNTRIIISAIKPGSGSLVFSVDGAQGVVTMPINVVDQNQVPPDVRPPDLPKETEDSGANPTDASAAADAGTDGGQRLR